MFDSSDLAAGWDAVFYDDGGINQSSVPRKEHQLLPALLQGRPLGYITRAVVLATYYTDEETRSRQRGNQVTVLCDVRPLGRQAQPLFKVPVLQFRQGLHDEDIFIPRPASKDITGAPLVITTRDPNGPRPTPAQNMDGDEVILGFLENDPGQPVIFPFTMGHGGTRHPRTRADGRVRRIRHNGTLIEIDKEGNLNLDATEAAKEELDTSGEEQSNAGTGGIITIKTKDGGGAELSLELDEDGDVMLQDGGGTEYLMFTKDAMEFELAAGLSGIITAGASLDVTAGATLDVTAPTQTFTPSAQFKVDTAVTSGIILGSGTIDSLVKFNQGWLPFWTNIMTNITALLELYDPTNTPPTQPQQVSGSDFWTLLDALKKAFDAYVGGLAQLTTGTQVTRAA